MSSSRKETVQCIQAKCEKLWTSVALSKLRRMEHNKTRAPLNHVFLSWNFKKTTSRHFVSPQVEKTPFWGQMGLLVMSLNVTNQCFPLMLPRPRLVCWADRQPYIALSSAFFVILLSSRGEDSRWSSGKDCQEVCTSGHRRVHAHLTGEIRGIFARYTPEAHTAPADRQQPISPAETAILGHCIAVPVQTIKTPLVALGQRKVSCFSAFSALIDGRVNIDPAAAVCPSPWIRGLKDVPTAKAVRDFV